MTCGESPGNRSRSWRLIAFLIVGMMQAGAVGLPGQTGNDLLSGMAGKLVAVFDSSISVRNDEGTRTFRVNKETKIWRGHDVDIHQLHLGDDIGIQYRVSSGKGEAIAASIWASIDHWGGTISKVFGDRVQIARRDDHEKATIIFDSNTIFDEGTRNDLQVGRFLEVIGLDSGNNRMHASRVLHILHR
jgi:hypothetical protein